jgi:hypothetical protein
MKTIWEKMPSVTTGGKPYFWVHRAENGCFWTVVWNRIAERWVLETSTGSILGYFDTDKEAKKAAEEPIKNFPLG